MAQRTRMELPTAHTIQLSLPSEEQSMNMKRLGPIAILLSVLWLSPGSITARVNADDAKAKNGESSDVGKHDVADDEVKAVPRDDEYYELLKLFADTLDQIERNYVKDLSRRELMEAAIKGMLSKLDQYSTYIPPKEIERFKVSVESEFGGIGIQVNIQNGFPTVISPIYGSPAYKSGMLAGDQIIKIDGKTAKGITLDEAVKRMKGEVGTEVKVTVRHIADKKEEEFKIKRAIVRVQTVLGDTRKPDDAWEFMFDKEKKIGYLRLTAFSRRTAEELRSALEELKAADLKALILDLRFNPGGLLSSAIEISDMFVEDGIIVSTKGRNISDRVWDAHEKGTFSGFPMAVLVNHYSASASEIVSACLQDHERAVIIGERTWGKGSVQNIIHLEDGKSALKLTTASYHRPNGKNIHKFPGAKEEDEWGVLPSDDFEIKFNDFETTQLMNYRRQRDILRKKGMGEDEPKFDDKQMKKALEHLTKQLAKNDKQTAEADAPAAN